ncbi:hypothetical protein M2152_001931 [Microbacteriaceae bacterium SG_E_30_P1]|uniref:Uncharacterized protein n=1 Tax=Antiquaquibacter oligotrophicus TaxID=2880260 RepID=A0ABT6KRC2_9MICO|nr:hypothetical protein [Antiquaquibacter oligotrophicus]MDH6181749.1 hypothetical protein [Antiquaquibacter oligotrophicus]UDF12570.1 hypothetical protein LH407_10445 [Antiquaquibacter oligotrophicus]
MSLTRLLAVAAAVLLLAGCTATEATPTPSTSATAQSTPSPTPMATPEAPTASAIVLSLAGLAVVDSAGEAIREAAFTDPDGVLSLLDELNDTEPGVTDFTPKGFTSYQWPDVAVNVWAADTSVVVTSATIAGLPVRTADGVHVGSTRADVTQLLVFDVGYDEDGDGTSDWFGLEPVTVDKGTEYIGVGITGDTVTKLRAPDSDFRDI